MTTGRINQVAAMRTPAPIVGHRRAIDEITKHDRLAWSHSDRQPTKGNQTRERHAGPDEREKRANARIFRSPSEHPLRGRNEQDGRVLNVATPMRLNGSGRFDVRPTQCRIVNERIDHHLGRATASSSRQRDVDFCVLHAPTRLLHKMQWHVGRGAIG
jgi:hypothetical protein